MFAGSLSWQPDEVHAALWARYNVTKGGPKTVGRSALGGSIKPVGSGVAGMGSHRVFGDNCFA